MSIIHDPRERALELAKRSPCSIQHGAVLIKQGKIIGEGYNYAIGEQGVHAEFAAIHDALKRCGGKKKCVWGARLLIVGIRKRNGKFVGSARPCERLKPRFKNASKFPCMKLVREAGINEIEYTIKNGSWVMEYIT